MILKKHDIKKVESNPISDEWTKCWHGLCVLKACRTSPGAAKKKNVKKIKEKISNTFGDSVIRTSEAEKHTFLSIMASIQSETALMFELGAGRGDWVMATHATAVNQLVPTKAKNCRCIAVEGEPTHFKWTKAHIKQQNINCQVLHAAVTKDPGHCFFEVSGQPSDSYGQSIVSSEHRNRKNLVKLRAYSIDELMNLYDFPHLHFIHMDIQGEEYNALRGASNALKNNSIDHLMVCTHGRAGKDNDIRNRQIKKFMTKYDYDLIMDIPPKNLNAVSTPLGDVVADGDGLMLLSSRKIK